MKNQFETRGDTTVIYLDKIDGTKFEAYIDNADLSKAQQIKGKWHAHYTTSGNVYVKTTVGGIRTKDGRIFLHRFLLDAPDDMVVDHIDQNPLNNRRSNLRVVTQQINSANRNYPNKNNSSGKKNVRWHKQANKWQAYLRENNKFISLGLYEDINDAVAAVQNYKQEGNKMKFQLDEKVKVGNKVGKVYNANFRFKQYQVSFEDGTREWFEENQLENCGE